MSEKDFSQNVLAPIRGIVGEDGIITDPQAMEPYLNSWRDNWRGRSPLIVRPRTWRPKADCGPFNFAAAV